MVIAIEDKPTELNVIDLVATILVLGFILIETIADQQQWNYQQAKKKCYSAGKGIKEEYYVGFIRSGLFAKSRHPNFFAE